MCTPVEHNTITIQKTNNIVAVNNTANKHLMLQHYTSMSPPFGPHVCDTVHTLGDKEDDFFSKGDYSNALTCNKTHMDVPCIQTHVNTKSFFSQQTCS